MNRFNNNRQTMRMAVYLPICLTYIELHFGLSTKMNKILPKWKRSISIHRIRMILNDFLSFFHLAEQKHARSIQVHVKIALLKVIKATQSIEFLTLPLLSSSSSSSPPPLIHIFKKKHNHSTIQFFRFRVSSQSNPFCWWWMYTWVYIWMAIDVSAISDDRIYESLSFGQLNANQRNYLFIWYAFENQLRSLN